MDRFGAVRVMADYDREGHFAVEHFTPGGWIAEYPLFLDGLEAFARAVEASLAYSVSA